MSVYLNQKPVKPVWDVPKQTFYRSERKKAIRSICDENGKKLNEETIEVIVKTPISASELEHEGMTCEMFSIENLQRSGVDPTKEKPITRPLFRGSLDDISFVTEQLNNTEYINNLEKELTNE